MGIAKKRSARALSKAGLVPLGGVWAVRCRPLPIKSREHQLNVAKYIPDHAKKGAAVFSLLTGQRGANNPQKPRDDIPGHSAQIQSVRANNHRPFQRIAMLGAGAVGGYYGARLAQHGHDVHFLMRTDYDTVRRIGLTIKSVDGDFRIPPDAIRVYDDPRQMPQADLVIVTLKATSNDAYDALIRPLLKDDTTILTLQNGLGNEDLLAGLFGAGRVLGGMAFVCINRAAPGVIHHTDHGVIRLGEYNGGPSERASRIAQMFNASRIKCEVLDDLKAGRWQKLVWNIPFNGLGAALDLTTDRLIGTEEGQRLVTAIIEEVIAAAKSQGVEMPPDILERQITHTRTMGAYKSSMQVDRQQGRPMEVEAILGEPLRRAAAAGVPTPHLEALYHLVRAVDAARNVR